MPAVNGEKYGGDKADVEDQCQPKIGAEAAPCIDWILCHFVETCG
jgi:hypothetical protein